MKLLRGFIFILPFIIMIQISGSGEELRNNHRWPKHIQTVPDVIKPLQFECGKRHPLYLRHAMDPWGLEDTTAEKTCKKT